MDKAVIMVARVLKEVGINNSQGNAPIFVWDVRIYVSGTENMEEREKH
jgi:ribosome-associated protein YbcJ (S4-like RNA binding protein)